jgi:hypothetical protein
LYRDRKSPTSLSNASLKIYATNFVGVLAIAEVVELLAVPAICIAKTPPKGPAGLGFASLTRQTPD